MYLLMYNVLAAKKYRSSRSGIGSIMLIICIVICNLTVLYYALGESRQGAVSFVTHD